MFRMLKGVYSVRTVRIELILPDFEKVAGLEICRRR